MRKSPLLFPVGRLWFLRTSWQLCWLFQKPRQHGLAWVDGLLSVCGAPRHARPFSHHFRGVCGCHWVQAAWVTFTGPRLAVGMGETPSPWRVSTSARWPPPPLRIFIVLTLGSCSSLELRNQTQSNESEPPLRLLLTSFGIQQSLFDQARMQGFCVGTGRASTGSVPSPKSAHVTQTGGVSPRNAMGTPGRAGLSGSE